MEESGNPFRKAGLALLLFGLIDIAFMVYCIVNKISYSSSFNIFAVLAGVFLLRGGVRTARIVRWFNAFMIAGFIGALIILPLILPFGLMKTYLALNAMEAVGSALFSVLFVAFLIWIQRELSTPGSLYRLGAAGYNTGPPKSAYITGLILVVLLAVLVPTSLRGESGQKAIQLAQEKLGDGYKYHVTSLSVSNTSGHAIVVAYNDSEIQQVEVRW